MEEELNKLNKWINALVFFSFFTVLKMSMIIEDTFDTSFSDPDNEMFKLYAGKIKSAVSGFIFCK